ncbi:MAG: translocation/assembly module TamB domain-containing protein [Candidatus Marinimicrobia bacterium]|nr:translocation/assembly module TamB domain-containing protein [Candidatus Neomarinimicrobiota bacterium]
MKTYTKRSLIYAALGGILLALILSVGLVWLSSEAGETFLLDKILTTLNSELNAEIRADRLKTNFFGSIMLENVGINHQTPDQPELITLKRMAINIDWWQLIRKQIQIDRLEIDTATIHIWADSTNTWLVTELFPTDSLSESEWSLAVGEIHFKNTKVFLSAPDLNIDMQLEPLEFVATAIRSGYDWNLKSGWVNIAGLDSSASLQMSGSIDTEKILIESAILQSQNYTLNTSGTIEYLKDSYPLDLNIDFQGEPTTILSFLGPVIEIDFPSICGNINAHFRLTQDLYHPHLQYDGLLQSFSIQNFPELNGTMSGLITAEIMQIDTMDISSMDIPMRGKALIRLDDVYAHELAVTIPEFEIDKALSQIPGTGVDYSGLLQGQLSSQGSLLNLEDLLVAGDFNVSKARFLNKPISDSKLHASVQNGSVIFNLSQANNLISVKARLDSITDLSGSIQVNLENLGPLAGLTPFAGASGKVLGSGTFSRLGEKIKYSSTLSLNSVSYEGFNIEAGRLVVSGSNKSWKILSSSFTGSMIDLSLVNRFLPRPRVYGFGSYQISVSGTSNDLVGNLSLVAENMQIDSVQIDSSRFNLSATGTLVLLDQSVVNLYGLRSTMTGSYNWKNSDTHLNVALSQNTGRRIEKLDLLNFTGAYQAKTFTGQFDFNDFEISDMELLPGELDPLSGRLSGNLKFSAHSEIETIETNIKFVSPSWHDEHFDQLSLKGSYKSKRVSLETLQLERGKETIQCQVSFPFDLRSPTADSNTEFLGRLVIENFKLSNISQFLPTVYQLSGIIDSDLKISGPLSLPRINGTAKISNLDFRSYSQTILNMPSLAMDFKEQSLSMREQAALLGATPLKFGGSFSASSRESFQLLALVDLDQQGSVNFDLLSRQKRLDTKIKVTALNLAVLDPLLDPQQHFGGIVNGVLDVKNLSAVPIFNGNISITNGSAAFGSDLPLVTEFQSDIGFKDTSMTIRLLKGKMGTIPFASKGHIRHQGWERFYISNEIEVSGIKALTLSGNISRKSMDLLLNLRELNLAALQPFVKEAKGLTGFASADMHFSGELLQPAIGGQLVVRDVSFLSAYLNTPLHSGKLSAHFTGNKVTLDSVSFKQGLKGQIRLKGSASTRKNALPHLNFVLVADRINLKETKSVKAEIKHANLNFSNTQDGYLISGEIRSGNAILKQKFSPQDIVRIAVQNSTPTQEVNPLFDKTSLRVKIFESETINIDNNLANVKLKPDLSIIGTLARPIPVGRLRIMEGHIFYLDRKFMVISGIVDFQDSYKVNPIVDFHAKTELKPYQTRSKQEYTIYLDVLGPLDAATVELRSDPVLDRTDILTLLTMGATRKELTSYDPSLDDASISRIVQDRLADYSSQKISGFASNKIGTVLNLDQVRIEGNLFDFSSTWGPQLVASKKLNEQTTLTYGTTIGQATDQNIKLEYEIKEGMSIEGQTDQKGRSGLDLKFGFKFK